MALQSSGTISTNNINVELGRSGSAQFSINGSEERALAGIASGTISLASFYGKSAREATITVGNMHRNTIDTSETNARRYGWSASGKSNYWHFENSNVTSGFGSISKTTGLVTSGTLLSLQMVKYNTACNYHLELATTRSSNGGFTTMHLQRSGSGNNGYSFNRTSAGGFQQTINNYGDPDISGSYKWVFTSATVGGSVGPHGAGTSATTLAQLWGEWTNNSTGWTVTFS
jgi:hypothetical protein